MQKIMTNAAWQQFVNNRKDPEAWKKLGGALSYHFNEPERRKNEHLGLVNELNAKISEFTTTGDFPLTQAIKSLKSFQQQTHFDSGYEEIFDVEDFTNTNESGYDIENVTDGLTFALKLPGEKVDIFTMSGTKYRVFFNFYGGGLGWHQILIDDQEYWKMDKTLRTFRNRAYSLRAQSFYSLIEGIPAAQNIAWQLPIDLALPNTARNYTAERDVATINLACRQIFQNNKNIGYNMDRPDTTEFIIVVPLELWQRAKNAMALNLQGFSGSQKQSTYNWRLIVTDMFTTRNVYYVCLPKQEAIAGYRMDLKLFEDFDITNIVHTMTGWMRWGGSIGNVQQFQRCAIV